MSVPWKSAWAAIAAGAGAIVMMMVLGDLGGGLLDDLLLHLPGVDKVLHVVQSFVIFAVIYFALTRTALSPPMRITLAAGGAVAAAALDEVQQRWMGDRSVELADIAAGVAGIAIGVAWHLASERPRAAAALAACGVLGGVLLTYDSHLETRDYNRGLLAEREGRRQDAVRHYRAAVEARVQNPEVYNALAWAMVESGTGDAREAVGYAEQSLAMRPGNPDTLDTYGWALYRAGRASDAVAPLEAALAAKPDIYCIHYHLGMVYLELGRMDEGIGHLRRQIAEMPRTQEARLSADVLARVEAPRNTR